MNSIINALWNQYLKIHKYQINYFLKYPIETQAKQLRTILKTAQNTEWGLKYNFASVSNPKEWAQRVPVQDYELFKSDIERMMRGEKNILWPGAVKYFAKSSGTTSDRSKYIPVTDAFHQGYLKGGWRLLAFMYENLTNPTIVVGKSIVLAGSTTTNHPQYPGAVIGDISAVELQRTPYLVQKRMFPSMDINLMENFEVKLEWIARNGLREDIRMVAGTPTWALVLFRRMLELTGKDNILEIWPNMQVFVHGAVSFVPYVDSFRQLFPAPNFGFQETYNASEGYFAVQGDFSQKDMLLILDNGIYYEFMTAEEWDKEFPKTIPLEEVEVGTNYAMVITTNGGLYRYNIGDTVCFTSTNPFKIKITGRTKQYINVFGEEVMVANTDAALQMTCQEFGVKAKEYMVAPIFLDTKEKGGHEWVIEFESQTPDPLAFSKALDDNLKKLNSDYEAKRFNDLALLMLKLNIAKSGTFFEWMKSKNKVGPQQKVPRLSNHREYINDLLAFIK